MDEKRSRERWIAIITGAFSVFLGLIYLILITLLDARGPMLPPPPEALVGVVIVADDLFEVVQQPF